MQATAAVINAGLGDISLGLEMAGFQVVAAYESDEKALAIHKANLNIPVYQFSPEKFDVISFPAVDLLVARLYLSPFSRARHLQRANFDSLPWKLCDTISAKRPKALFMLLNAMSLKNEDISKLIETISGIGYQCELRAINVAQATGLPVVERAVCFVGTLKSIGKPVLFPEYADRAPEREPQWERVVDPWYCRYDPDEIVWDGDNRRFYCWKNRAYVGADCISWNTRMVPLVNTGEALRKITHREIADLKGFPAAYFLPDHTNRQWLYQKLMYSGNVLACEQIASILSFILTNPWRSRQAERGVHLERLIARYLAGFTSENSIVEEARSKDRGFDFMLRQGNRNLYFEVKYSRDVMPASKVSRICEQLSTPKKDGLQILILANEIADSVKQQCLDQFGVSIWDVRNLLWQFEPFADIKNEFIASLDYATERIQPTPPVPDVLPNRSEEKRGEPSWKEKLAKILPGREQFHEYEVLCIEILKYILGDNLTLWEAQKSTDESLYRFDLCCKIKSGANHDFFDTIKHYFNTKYIVFEFKNYTDKISQKEIYTTEKYLYEKALRKVAIIISRSGADEHALQAARGSLRETGKLILCLSDNALLEMIEIKTRGEQEPASFLDALLDDLLVSLEK